MRPKTELSRRSFIQLTTAATGGLLISLYLDKPLAIAQQPPPPKVYPPDAFVHVRRDGNIVISSDPDHLVSTIGVSDMIIVHTADATMICPKSEAQRVKDLVGKIRERYGKKYE